MKGLRLSTWSLCGLPVLILLTLLTGSEGIRWLALRKAGLQWNVSSACRQARVNLGLARRQVKLCRTTVDAMPHVVKAAVQATSTCQSVFSDRRWNCSSIEDAPRFSADLTTGTREQAYVYALSSAAIAYTISRGCAMGSLFHCSCSSPPRDPPNGNFKWGGCGDNVKWGAQFGKQFTDSEERRTADPEKKVREKTTTTEEPRVTVRQQRRNSKGYRSSDSERTVSRAHYGPSEDAKVAWRVEQNGQPRIDSGIVSESDHIKIEQERQRKRIWAMVAAVNLHNNRAGRRAVESSLVTMCKCHGVSGSCNIKTCWRALPRFSEVGEKLKRRFSMATEVVSRKVGAGRKLLPASPTMGSYNQDDLIYVTKSPDYCMRNLRVGSLGTRGRSCNSSSTGYDSCDEMCCGRGYRTVIVERVERCQCKYYWCCFVKCKTCRRWVETHECN